MSSTQPPDPWQAHPSTPEHEVYEPDPDDDDTEPLQVSTPSPDDWDPRDRHRPLARGLPATVPRLARGDGPWPSSFDTPLVVNPRSVRGTANHWCPRHRRVGDSRRRRPGLLVVASVGRYAQHGQHTLTTTTAPASRSPDADAADPVARGRLLSLLPPGYPSEACKPAALPETHWQSSVAKRTPTRPARCRPRTRWCATKPRWVGLSS